MSNRYFEIRRESGHGGNFIPSGRQLPRTPPLQDVKRCLDFDAEDSGRDCENMEEGTRGREENGLNQTFEVAAAEMKTEPGDHSMLRGMKGYQLTPGDLEFIQKMQEEKLITKLKKDLEEVQRVLKNEMMAAERIFANRKQALAELEKFPACEELSKWAKVVLETTAPSAEVEDLNTKALLAMMSKDDIVRVMDRKRAELKRMRKMVEDKRKKEAKERERLEKHIASEQSKLQGLMSELSDLKSELTQQEEAYRALQAQIDSQETSNTKAEKVETWEERRDAKSQVKRQKKERKNPAKASEKTQGGTNQSKPMRQRLADSQSGDQTGEKDDRDDPVTGRTWKAKPKSEAVARKPTKPAAQKRAEGKESKSQESEAAVRERIRAPGKPKTVASQPKNQPEAGDEAPNAGLRRSKRIASRR